MNRDSESSKGLAPRRVLLIDPDPAFAAGLRQILGRDDPAQVWLWHERTPELALTLLAVCEFDLILFTLPSLPRTAARLVHAIAETALGTSLLLLGSGWPELDPLPVTVVGVSSRQEVDQVGEKIAQALGYPDQALVF